MIACGSFVGLVSGTITRALAAATLAYGGLAWLAVIAPSLVLYGEHVPCGAAQAWPLRVLLAMTCGLSLLASHRAALSRAMRRLPRALAVATVTGLSAWRGAASLTSAAMRVGLLLWLLVTVPDTSQSPEPTTEGPPALLAFVAALIALTLTTAAPQEGLIAAGLLLLHITRQSVAGDVAAGAGRLLFDGMTVVMAVALGFAADPAQ